MYVDTVVSRQRLKDGMVREYSTVLLRRSVRNCAKVGKETLANLSALPSAAIEAVRASLAGKTLIVGGEGLRTVRSLPHGHVAAVWAQAAQARPAPPARRTPTGR